MIKEKTRMPVIDMAKRITSFYEVNLGYQMEEALLEASRCLDCKHQPCVNGCPVAIDIPGFIKAITLGNIALAYDIIEQSSSLPGVCGRVCPQEVQCEAVCVCGIKGEPVAIGHLERFVADWHYQASIDINRHEQTKEKIAIIGSGPAGISCAHELNLRGYHVEVFEALHMSGGVLSYGIPAFRLPKNIVDFEIESLKKRGVIMHHNVVIGKTLTFDDLYDMGFKAIFIGTGAGLPKFMNIRGEMLNGVYSANEFLTRINLMKAYEKEAMTPIYKGKRVAVIGGGNVALDAARCALRLGADEVHIIYRRSEKELPARKEEYIHAKEEGIIFNWLTQLKEIIADDKGNVKSISCVKMKLTEPDETHRRKPIEDPYSQFIMDIDEVIMAIGTTPNPLLTQANNDLQTTREGCIVVDQETQESSIPLIYAGGDIVTGSATVILAMGAGKKAAQSIDLKLQKKRGTIV